MREKAVSMQAIDITKLIIRKVTEADLPALEWNGEYLKFRRMFASIYRDTLLGKALMWIITSPQGEIIGQAFIILQSGDKDTADGKTRAYLFSFRVKSPYRNQGIGTYLMQFIEKDLQSRRFKYITLNVAKDNLNAVRLYERLGYRITGSRPGNWSYLDHQGKIQHVFEPSWRMIKKISRRSQTKI